MSKESLGRDINGYIDYTLPNPVACYDMVLPADTVKTTTAPANFNRAFFSYAPGTSVWVTLDGSTPEVPASDGASTQELCPAGRQLDINGGTVIKAISDTASVVNIRYDLGQ